MEAREIIMRELERCRPMLEDALAYQSFHTFADVEQRIADNQAMLWPGEKSAFVSTLEDYPAGPRVIQTWLAGGDKDELVNVLRPQIEAQARGWGCTHAMIDGGRSGWERVLSAHGYEPQGVILMKDLRA